MGDRKRSGEMMARGKKKGDKLQDAIMAEEIRTRQLMGRGSHDTRLASRVRGPNRHAKWKPW